MSVWGTPSIHRSDLVFSQNGVLALKGQGLGERAARYFGATLDLSGTPAEPSLSYADTSVLCTAHVVFRLPADALGHHFRLSARAATLEDYAAAEAAEAAGNATGMATLAKRCSTLWIVEASNGCTEAARFLLLATLASSALGPVLPYDRATLLGVRSARLLAEKALGTAALSRTP